MRRLNEPANPAQGAAGAAPSASVSKADFDRLLDKLSATQKEKDQLVAGLDTDKNGEISRDEFLKGLAATQGTTQGSETSQALMHLMDRNRNGNGVVESAEFGRFSASFLDAAQHRA
jgi:Ca2+-binding EF-hand superfamily protein